MKAQELIDQFVVLETARLEKVQAENTAMMERSKSRFMANCRIWLGDLLEELEPGPIEGMTRYSNIAFMLPVIFEGICGEVFSGASDTSLPDIKFQILNFKINSNFIEVVKLPYRHVKTMHNREYDIEATKEVGAAEIGKMLMSVREAKRVHDQTLAEEATKGREAMKNYRIHQFEGSRSVEEVRKILEEAKTVFPEEAEEWDHLAQRQIDYLEMLHQQEETKQKKNQLIEDEIVRLQKAEKDAFKPLVLYKITYGDSMHAEEGDGFYLNDVWCTRDKPDKDGWWVEIRYGRLHRIRLEHVIKVEQISFESPDELPIEASMVNQVKSVKFEGVEIGVKYIPDNLREVHKK